MCLKINFPQKTDNYVKATKMTRINIKGVKDCQAHTHTSLLKYFMLYSGETDVLFAQSLQNQQQ